MACEDAPIPTHMHKATPPSRQPYTLGFNNFEWRYESRDEDAIRGWFGAPSAAMQATRQLMQSAWFAECATNPADASAGPADAPMGFHS